MATWVPDHRWPSLYQSHTADVSPHLSLGQTQDLVSLCSDLRGSPWVVLFFHWLNFLQRAVWICPAWASSVRAHHTLPVISGKSLSPCSPPPPFWFLLYLSPLLCIHIWKLCIAHTRCQSTQAKRLKFWRNIWSFERLCQTEQGPVCVVNVLLLEQDEDFYHPNPCLPCRSLFIALVNLENLCRSGWPQTFNDLLLPTFLVVELWACVSMARCNPFLLAKGYCIIASWDN
jgi:hypothetical protein